jgi:hypothetical protein
MRKSMGQEVCINLSAENKKAEAEAPAVCTGSQFFLKVLYHMRSRIP